MSVHEDQLKAFFEGVTGTNIDYEPNDIYSGTLIIDNDSSQGIPLSVFIEFEKLFNIKITNIRKQNYGFYVDVSSKDKIDYDDY